MSIDIGVIIAVVGSAIANIGVVISMMFWVRSEANMLRVEQKEDRKDLLQVSRNLEITMISIQNEMKDFHQRLLDIEKHRVKVS
jgi:Ca2+/Na+ antiporter